MTNESNMPKEIWACDAHLTINQTEDRVGLFTSIEPTGKSCKYIREDIASTRATPTDAAVHSEALEALQIGRHVLLMMSEIKKQGGSFKYIAVAPNEKCLAVVDKFTPEEEAEIIKYAEFIEANRAALSRPPIDWEGLEKMRNPIYPPLRKAHVEGWNDCLDHLKKTIGGKDE